MVKRILLGLFVVAGLYLGVGLVVRLLASDETRIRWLVEQMEEGYNTGHPGSCVGPLAKDWRHEGYGVDREMLLGGLFQTARDRDPKTRELRSRVTTDLESLAIAVDGDRATLTARATFEGLRGGAWQEVWRLEIEAELERRDEGWRIVRSRHHDLQGTFVGR